MGTATTFTQLIANPGSEKVVLVEIQPCEVIVNWTKTGGLTNVYQVSYLGETLTLNDSSTETIRKEIAELQEDGVALTAVASTAACDAAASSYYHDLTNGILYCHTSGSDSPGGYTMVGLFWLRFATKGIILDGHYYEPYIEESGIPQITQSVSDIHWGISEIGSGTLILNNNRGYFNQIAHKCLWVNRVVRVILGGDSLPYSEYTRIFTGWIAETDFDVSGAWGLSLKSKAFGLLRQIPLNNFWASDYPDLDPAAEGTVIPYYYGLYDVTQAPVVTCVNTAYAANTYQFKVADHAIKSITQVYVDYDDGAGWQTIAHANEDLALATFTITSATFVVGMSKVKVAFEGKASGGVLIDGAPEVAEDILQSYCGYGAADFHAASWTESKSVSDCVLNVDVTSDITTLSVIERICLSDLAFFYENANGELIYRTWEPSVAGTVPTLTSLDILDSPLPKVIDSTESLFWKVKVGYSKMLSRDTYLYCDSSTSASRYKYAKSDHITLDTYLRTAANAQSLGDRINWITREPSPIIAITLKASQVGLILGDKVKVTLAGTPYVTAGGYVDRVFEVIGRDLSCFPLELTLTGRDLMGWGSGVGFWMSASAPAWVSATEQERDSSGFWCDASGYADPAGVDETSKNISLWW